MSETVFQWAERRLQERKWHEHETAAATIREGYGDELGRTLAFAMSVRTAPCPPGSVRVPFQPPWWKWRLRVDYQGAKYKVTGYVGTMVDGKIACVNATRLLLAGFEALHGN